MGLEDQIWLFSCTVVFSVYGWQILFSCSISNRKCHAMFSKTYMIVSWHLHFLIECHPNVTFLVGCVISNSSTCQLTCGFLLHKPQLHVKFYIVCVNWRAFLFLRFFVCQMSKICKTIVTNTHWLCFILYLEIDMRLHYLTFMGGNLEIKKLMPIRIIRKLWIVSVFSMNSDAMSNMFSEKYGDGQLLRMVPRWTIFHVNSAGSITPPKFPSVSLNVWIYSEWIFLLCSRGQHNINDILQGHGTDPHGWILSYTPKSPEFTRIHYTK